MPPTRPPGLYEELITRRLEAALEEIRGEGWRDEVANLDAAEAPGVLARFVHDLVEPLLGSLTGDDRTARQLEIVNSLVDHLQSAVQDSPVLDDDALAPPARQLLSHVETPQVLRQFQTAFEQYREEGEFEAYDPADDAGPRTTRFETTNSFGIVDSAVWLDQELR